MKLEAIWVEDLSKEIGEDEIQGESIVDWPGKMVTFPGVNREGYYEPLRDCTLFIPDDRSCNYARRANNGWELMSYACDLTRDDILESVKSDKSISDDEAERVCDEVCAMLDIKVAYVVEGSKGAQAGTSGADWLQYATEHDTIDDARKEIIDCIASCHDKEDRGEDYEHEWESLMESAKTAEVGDCLTFDERSWRIVRE